MSEQFYIVDYYISRSMDNAALTILTSGHQICEPKWPWGPGIRDMYLLHYVKKGKGIYKVNDHTYALKAGDAFVIYPGSLCYYQADKEEPWEYYWVGFNGSAVKSLFFHTDFSIESPCRSFDEDLSVYIEKILACKGQESRHQAEMTGYLYILFSRMMRQEVAPKKPKDYRKEYVFKVHEFITQNYSNDISVSDLAGYVGLSRSHLHRIFVEETGDSPMQYLTKYRIEQSLNLLKATDMSIAYIASSVGFSDQLYFSRVFSKQMGISPSKYRKEAQVQKTPPETGGNL